MGLLTDLLGDGNATYAPAASDPDCAFRIVATGGNKTLTADQDIWTTIDASLDGQLAVEAGEWIEVGTSMAWGNEAVTVYTDVVTMVGGSALNSIGQDGSLPAVAAGVPYWRGLSSVVSSSGGVMLYQVKAGDIDSGLVTLRMLYAKAGSSTNKVLAADTTNPLYFFGRVLG